MKRLLSFIWYRFISFPFRLMPIKRNQIVFENFFGKGYGDTPKYIADALLKKGDYEIVWLVKDFTPELFPEGVKVIKRGSFLELYYLSTAKCWIDNSRKPYGLNKRKKQFYMQTWHGGFPIKQIEKAVENKLDYGYVQSAKNDSKMIDVLLSNNRFMTKIYKNDFWYDGKILECGCPRNDIIVKQDKKARQKVYEFYKIDQNCKLCLYAPTFRKDGSLDAYSLDFTRLKCTLEKKFGGKWKILVRLHPNIASKSSELVKYDDNIIDVSTYNDIQELLVAADFMITDYSSCIFDYALAKSKCCIFATDIEEYEKDRGFYIELNEYPFEIATTNDELSQCIEKYNESQIEKRIAKFFKQVGSFEDGNGTKDVVDYIKQEMRKNEKS